jgi:hypothetical protein
VSVSWRGSGFFVVVWILAAFLIAAMRKSIRRTGVPDGSRFPKIVDLIWGIPGAVALATCGWFSGGLILALGAGYILGKGGKEPEQPARRLHSLLDIKDAPLAGVAGLIFGLVVGLAAGHLAGLIVGSLVGIFGWLAFSLGRPVVDEDSPVDPITSWRRDHYHGMIFGLVVAVMFGSAYAISAVLVGGVSRGLVSASLVWIPVALATGLSWGTIYSELWPCLLANLQLRMLGKGPLNMMRFLEDARNRQVLRTVGPIYQFRHARLQDRLASLAASGSGNRMDCTLGVEPNP